jgi:hypothetical protein
MTLLNYSLHAVHVCHPLPVSSDGAEMAVVSPQNCFLRAQGQHFRDFE